MIKSPDKSKEKIESMFDEIAPAYDKLNHLFTLNIDVRWRKQIVKHISGNNIKAENILDLASGTGDLSKELIKLNPGIIYAADISSKMLEIQKIKSGIKIFSLFRRKLSLCLLMTSISI
ncbi:MAG: class I SAM-dependent methyltransferase [Ignavibacteria bacterium]|nr:class I SAM-dependent methyltransferase [Ignavibacteria bacterium]